MSEVVRKKLPEGWSTVLLQSVICLQKGKKPKDLGENSVERTIPYIDIKAFESGEIRKYCTNEKVVLCQEDDVLVVWDGARSGLVGFGAKGAVGSTIARVDTDGLYSKYLYYFLKRNYAYLNTNTRGVGIPHIDPGVFNNLEFPLAPPEQQKRIVAKIEELFSHIDAGIESLKKTQKLLKQYRQSILKAAVTGELTKKWREENKEKLEPASELLKRILKERRQKWEAQQVKQFKARGKMPMDDKWKDKYREGISPTKLDLDEISSYAITQDWDLMTADQLTYFLTDGEHATPPRTDKGIPLLSARNIQNGWLSFKKIDYVSTATHEKLNERLNVRYGDVLLSCSGTLGRSCIAPKNSKFSLVRSVAVLKPVLNNGEFMSYSFRSGLLQYQINKKKTQTAQANIFQGKIKTLIFPVPSIVEQNEIVYIVKGKFDAIEKLEYEIGLQLIKAEKNKNSILDSAFSGYLKKEISYEI